MALTILDRPSTGGQLGSAFGTGLKALAQSKLDSMAQRQRQSQTQKGLSSLQGFTPEMAESLSALDPQVLSKLLPELQRNQREQEFAKQFQGQSAQQLPGQEQQPGFIPEGFPAPRNSKEAIELAKISHKEKLQKEKMSAEEKRAAFKETKEERKALRDDYKTSKQDLEDLNRIQELEKEGKLDTAGYSEFLKRSGLDIPALMSEGSEEFQKITQNFIRNAKNYYGARISNLEMEQFLKTIPTLSQSPEGRKRVIANLKKIARGKEEYYKSYLEVMNENKGIPPYDLSDQVQEKADKKLDKLAESFKKDLEIKVPEGQNRFITALQTGAGSALGKFGGRLVPAAENAVLGAIAGSVIPGLGTTVGGGLGGLYGLIKG